MIQVLHFDRRCGPCHYSFSGVTQEDANRLYDQHIRECHPEVAQVGLLIDRIDKLLAVLEVALRPQLRTVNPDELPEPPS